MTKRQWLLSLVKRVRVTGPLPGTDQPIEINPRLCRVLLKMKLRELSKVASVALLAFGLTGCQTVNKDEACASATAAYAVYLAVIAAGDTPSADQILAAEAAAAVLRVQCGWEPPTKAWRGTGVWYDQYGVPVVKP